MTVDQFPSSVYVQVEIGKLGGEENGGRMNTARSRDYIGYPHSKYACVQTCCSWWRWHISLTQL